jgi:hypothetical protein
MAQFRPNHFDPQVNTSPGEKKLFERLDQSEEIPNWIILHSVDLLHHKFRVQGEADFVVLAPSLGILVIEVKHHNRIELKNGSWYLGGKQSKDPFRQASDGMFTIKKYLEDRDIDTRSIPMLHAVWFTNCSIKNLPESIKWDDGNTLGIEDLNSDPVAAIKMAFAEGKTRLERTIRFQQPVADFASLNRISETLVPNFSIHQPAKDRKKEVELELKRATEEQTTTLELLRNQKHLVVPGMAGTGKTFLAIHEAKQAHLRGEQALLICFNRMLAQQLSRDLKEFPRVSVKTIHSLLLEIAGEADLDSQSDSWWRSELPTLAVQALLAGREVPNFETLIIDEAQDVGMKDYLEFLDLLLSAGLADSKVRVFGDFRNQAIYLDGNESLSNFKASLPEALVSAELQVNCRNTRALGDFLNHFLELEPAYSGFRRTDKGELVESHHLKDAGMFSKSLNGVLEEMLKIYSPNDIVILSAHLKKLEQVVEACEFKFSKVDFLNSGRVRFGSIHKFKGMEALAVILVDFPESQISAKDTFYQAATRATSKFAYLMTDQRLEGL